MGHPRFRQIHERRQTETIMVNFRGESNMLNQSLTNAVYTWLMCLSLTYTWSDGTVHADDMANKYALAVMGGKIPASPNPAVVREKVTFNFALALYNEADGRVEMKPAELKSVYYEIKSEEAILEVTQGFIVQDSDTQLIPGNRRKATKNTEEDVALLSNVVVASSFSTVGRHYMRLAVTVTFKDDSTLEEEHEIGVNVVTANLTVYAAPPTRESQWRYRGVDYMYIGGDYGHSFWSVSVDPDAGNLGAVASLNGAKCGFYPRDGKSMVTVLEPMFRGFAVPGSIGNDETHSYSAARSYEITFQKAKATLEKVAEQAASNNLRYNFIAKANAENCTMKCNTVANTYAGVGAPTGEGKVAWKLTDATSMRTIAITIPNPYHHAKQLAENQNDIW